MSQLTIPQYLIESSICLIAFYTLYVLLLKKETFFQLNRFYLLISALSAVLIPFINFDLQYTPHVIALSDYVMPIITKAQLSHMSIVELVETPTPFIISVGDLIRLFYGLGVLVMGLKFLDALFKVINMIGKGRKEKLGDNTLVSHSGGVPSSSFFSYIFWNDSDSKKNAEVHKTIISHELVHVRQWHSLDVILIEILVIMKWFNPLIYLFRKSLRLTHEYIADRYMALQTDKLSYAHILIGQNQTNSALPLSNTFYSDIKERIQMMARINSSYWRLSKGLMIIPVYISMLSLFSFNFVDHIPGIADGIDSINKVYDKIESTEIVSIDPLTPNNPLASSMEGLTDIQQANLIIFKWGDMMYHNDPKEIVNDGRIFQQDSITEYRLEQSFLKKPMVFSRNLYWYDYEIDVTFHKNQDSYEHTIKVDEEYDGEKWKNIINDIYPDKVVIENLRQSSNEISLDLHMVIDIVEPPTSQFAYDLGQKVEVNGKTMYFTGGSSFNNRFMDFESIKKDELIDLVSDIDWINNLTDTMSYRDKDYKVIIKVDRDVVFDSDQLKEQLTEDPLIKRNYEVDENNVILSLTEEMTYDFESKNSSKVLREWIQSLDDGDKIIFNLYDNIDESEDLEVKSDGEMKDLFDTKGLPVIYPFVLSEYKDLYSPNLKLSNKFTSAKEESKYQIIYQTNGKTLIKIDRMDPENEKILKAFSDESKFDIIHIPNYKTKYRIVEYKGEYLGAAKKVIRLQPGLDDIEIHRLPEYDQEDVDLQLSWGKMNSVDKYVNFSIKQFHHSRKSNLWLTAGSERYYVNRFTIYIIDKSDNIQAYQSSSIRAYELNKVLQNISDETSIYIDDIIIDVDGEWQHVMDRFSFILE